MSKLASGLETLAKVATPETLEALFRELPHCDTDAFELAYKCICNGDIPGLIKAVGLSPCRCDNCNELITGDEFGLEYAHARANAKHWNGWTGMLHIVCDGCLQYHQEERASRRSVLDMGRAS